MPLGIFLPGRSGSGILFRDKFQLITTGLLNTPQESSEGCREILLPEFYSAFQFVESYGLLLGKKKKHSIDVPFHRSNLHLKKSHKQINC